MRRTLPIILMLLVLATAVTVADAQCPMCKLSAETNLSNGGTAGQGLNKGILYLFFAPYILIGGIAYFWWRNRQRDSELSYPELQEGQQN